MKQFTATDHHFRAVRSFPFMGLLNSPFAQRRYFASAFLFACSSIIFSTWITYIPRIAEYLSITEGRIGRAIFFASIGSFVMIPIAKKLVDRFGAGKCAYYALVIHSLVLFGPFLANSYPALCGALFVFGLSASFFHIALNSLTALVERQDGVLVMSGSHGFWSIGGVIGASTGGWVAAALDRPLLHVATVACTLICLQTWLRREYLFRKGETIPSGKKAGKRHAMASLFTIALIGLIMMVSEGAIADWGALYLTKIIEIPAAWMGMGYAAFSMSMMIGRFMGDKLSHRFGSWPLLSGSVAVSLCGFALVLIVQPVISLLGFFIVGFGFSVIVPEIFRLASKLEHVDASTGVAYISATTNIGFMVGPVLLGFIAESRSLHTSFAALTAFVSVALFLSLWKTLSPSRQPSSSAQGA